MRVRDPGNPTPHTLIALSSRNLQVLRARIHLDACMAVLPGDQISDKTPRPSSGRQPIFTSLCMWGQVIHPITIPYQQPSFIMKMATISQKGHIYKNFPVMFHREKSKNQLHTWRLPVSGTVQRKKITRVLRFICKNM